MPEPPNETHGVPKDVAAIRQRIKAFLNAAAPNGEKIGNAKWGVYAFYDYDAEPIYVGQTNENAYSDEADSHSDLMAILIPG